VDTHVLLWWFSDDPALSKRAKTVLTAADNDVLVSAASAWEMSIKTKLGKCNAQALLDHLHEELDEEGFEALPITMDHAVRAGALPGRHKDPFDRMLVAQAHAEKVAIISGDTAFDDYDIRRIW
jgi:PIN domain nuclease of toxin-antitoxin system